jgi:outer membrane PBP1 activator LpoA protein
LEKPIEPKPETNRLTQLFDLQRLFNSAVKFMTKTKHYSDIFLKSNLILSLIFCFLLNSCGQQLTQKQLGTSDLPSTENQTVEHAEALELRASELTEPKRSKALTKSIYIYSILKQFQKVEFLVQTIEPSSLNKNQLAIYNIAKARVFIFKGDSKSALSILVKNIEPTSLPIELQTMYSNTKAEAHFNNAEYLDSAKERIYINAFLEKNEKENNDRKIWLTLSQIEQKKLKKLSKKEKSPNLKSWLSLTLIEKSHGHNLETQVKKYEAWLKQNSNHDARSFAKKKIALIEKAVDNQPTKIAVLLPETGVFAKSADAIKHGFLSNYYSALKKQGGTPELLFINTDNKSLQSRFEKYLETASLKKIQSDENQKISEEEVLKKGFLLSYQEAVEQKAELIIGPINKDYIELLQSAEKIPTPTLSLNYSSRLIPNNKQALYQFGLSPDDEIFFITEQANERNYKNAAVLAPTGPWGERLVKSFESSWSSKGGSVVSQSFYEDTRSLTKIIEQMLNIDLSEKRFKKLYWYSGGKTLFHSRRRQDIDFIFLVGDPKTGRQIMPTFAFLDANDIPVFSNSNIYSGKYNPKDKDLNKLLFTEIPALTNPKQTTLSAWKNQDFRYKRLIAMGMDTYDLSLRLNILADSPSNTFYGETGQLSLEESNKIKRKPILAKFKGSKVTVQSSTF